MPQTWYFEPLEGIDSYVGKITIGKKSNLFFEYSEMGYADHLTPTKKEYLEKQTRTLADIFVSPFLKEGVTYVNKEDVSNQKRQMMRDRGITDSALVKVEADPLPMVQRKFYVPNNQQKLQFPNADYIAELSYHGQTKLDAIELPPEIKQSNMQIDSDQRFIYKTIWPKVAGTGKTGMYVQSRKSQANFVISAKNLSAADQADALKAFKTIRFKQ